MGPFSAGRSRIATVGLGAAGGVALVGALLAAAVGSGVAGADTAASPTAVSVELGAATPPAAGQEVEDLRAQVSALSTEVARLAGDEDEALAGRLGGERGGFTVAYGAPVAYVGPDDVVYQYQVGEEGRTGRVTAFFEEGRAQRLVVVPDRPEAKPLDEPDEADWSPEEALEVATAFLPGDAALAEAEVDPAAVEEVGGTSEALAAAVAPEAPGACPPAGGAGFNVLFTRPTDETVSAVTLETAAGGPTLAAGELVEADQGRTQRGGSARANSSLGGNVTANGVRISATDTRPDAAVENAPAEGSVYAVQVEIENGTNASLAYQPSDFVLVADDGRELSASCGGLEPAIAAGELAPGEAIDGWVSFVVPEDFTPERFVVLTANARVGFEL